MELIPAIYYQRAYLCIVTFFTLVFVGLYGVRPGKSQQYEDKKGYYNTAILLTLFMIVFIGLRPIDKIFADMTGYAQAMIDHRFEKMDVTWDNNFVFTPMMAFLSSHKVAKQVPIIVLAFINFGATFLAVKKMFPNDVMIVMLVFFGAFSTFGAATNGLKAGCAMALFLVALAYCYNIKYCLLFLILSIGFHHSMQLPIIVFIICYFYRNTKVYMGIWIFCLILAAVGDTLLMEFFGELTDDSGAEYLLTFADSKKSVFTGKLGFRYDFVVYSIVPIIIGWYTLRKNRVLSEGYSLVLNVYILTNAAWMLCMYASFTNRIAYLSWGLYPFLVIYPFVNGEWGEDHKKWLYYASIAHLGFTLFMAIVYY